MDNGIHDIFNRQIITEYKIIEWAKINSLYSN